MARPRLLDLYCKAGGAAKGYADAGFDVVGVDIEPQPRYPFAFIQADVMALDPRFLQFFDAIHASPPCQAHSNAQRIQRREHPDLIAPTRRMLRASGAPYIIENVEGAPLIDPVVLCGAQAPLHLKLYRHRAFEVSFPVRRPAHFAHVAPQTKMGRPPQDGEFMHVVGNFSGVERAREVMGIDWMTRDELREAIPPAYTEYLGKQLLAHLALKEAA